MGKSIVRQNAERDPTYNPYCMRCSRLVRMKLVEPFYWRCFCGAEHDEREDEVAKTEVFSAVSQMSFGVSFALDYDADRDEGAAYVRGPAGNLTVFHFSGVVLLQMADAIKAKVGKPAEPESLKLICDPCGFQQQAPFDVGDQCVCGGTFRDAAEES